MGYKYERGEDYTSRNQERIDDLTKQYTNRSFEYDAATDEAYQNYANMMRANGALAMKDTVGKASSMTGGYGNSYASTAGQQVYNDYLNEIGNAESSFYDRALSQFNSEGSNMLNQISLLQNQENADKASWEEAYAKDFSDAETAARFGDYSQIAELYGVDEETYKTTINKENLLPLTQDLIDGYYEAWKKGEDYADSYFGYLKGLGYNTDSLDTLKGMWAESGKIVGGLSNGTNDAGESTGVSLTDSGIRIDHNINAKIKGVGKLEKGQNFHIKKKDENWDVQLGNEVSDIEALTTYASSEGSETGLVAYNGEIYYIGEGKVFAVEAQPLRDYFGGDTENDYQTLKRILLGED